jgi:hypothetical protein
LIVTGIVTIARRPVLAVTPGTSTIAPAIAATATVAEPLTANL